MNYGTKFRLNKVMNKVKARKIFLQDINVFLLKLSYNYNTPLQAFTEWKLKLIEYFENFLDLHLNKPEHVYFRLNKIDIAYLEDIKSKYIFVPVDKAANNYAIFCKKFFVESIQKELNNETVYTLYRGNKKVLINGFF